MYFTCPRLRVKEAGAVARLNPPLTSDNAALTRVSDHGRMNHPPAALSEAALVLRGRPASAGEYTGIVRVIDSAGDLSQALPGDVIVCRSASREMLTAIPDAGALVTDDGGALSNAATLARECGIPAVVAAHDATRRLRTGQRVLVDGARGTVRVCEGSGLNPPL